MVAWPACIAAGGLIALDLSLGWWWPTGKARLNWWWGAPVRRSVFTAIFAILLLVSTFLLFRDRFDEAQIIGCSARTNACPGAPDPAQGAGYCANTLNATVFNPSTIDFDLSK